MKRIFLSISMVALVVLFATNASSAQQWSAEQQDVWSGVEKYWQVSASGDAQAFLAYFDESYMGWEYDSKVPQNKESTGKWIVYGMQRGKVLFYTLSPVAIWVKGDFAFVDYFYDQVVKDNETEKTKERSGKWTDILMKKDGKWVLIGDHGGDTSKDD